MLQEVRFFPVLQHCSLLKKGGKEDKYLHLIQNQISTSSQVVLKNRRNAERILKRFKSIFGSIYIFSMDNGRQHGVLFLASSRIGEACPAGI